MNLTRRDVIKAMGAAGAVAALGPAEALSAVRQTAAPLRILFIGGTGFIGPHMVRRALARGHTVTLFNRGRTAPELFHDLELLKGDRDNDLSALEGRRRVLGEDAVSLFGEEESNAPVRILPPVAYFEEKTKFDLIVNIDYRSTRQSKDSFHPFRLQTFKKYLGSC